MFRKITGMQKGGSFKTRGNQMHTRCQESRIEFSMHHSARLHSIGFYGLPFLRRRRLSVLSGR